jgi:hypothetical protein
VVFRKLRDLTATIELAVTWSSGNKTPVIVNFIEAARKVASTRADKK